MKKLFIISLLFLVSQLFAQNTTQVHATNGLENIPSTKVNGNVKIGIANTGVPSGVYTNGIFTINSRGQVTLAAQGPNLAPKFWQWSHWWSIVDVGNPLTISQTGQQIDNVVVFQNVAASNDTFHVHFTLDAGTYNFNVVGLTDNSRGIQRWDIINSSGVTNTIGSMDWYAGSAGYSVIKTIPNVIIPSAGTYKLQSVVTNKNGSSSGYTIVINGGSFQRVGD